MADSDLGAAGATSQSKQENPTYYAWKPFAGKSETEYDANFVGAQSPERVKHVQKSTEPSLEGIINQSDASPVETEYDSKFVGTQSPEPVVHVEKTSEPTLEGIINQNDVLVSETEYDAMTKDAEANNSADAVEHVKKSADPSLQGILDLGCPLGSTEYDAAFKTSFIEQVTKAQKEVKASLEGIFKYPDVQNTFVSEYDANFAPKEDTSTTVDTVAAMQDEGASAESADPTSGASETSVATLEPQSAQVEESAPDAAAESEPQSEPVIIMDGGDSASEAISPAEAPTPAPATETEVPMEETTPTEDPEPESEPVVENKFNAFESVSHMTYKWPITAGKKPVEGKVTSSDLVFGVMQAAPQDATLESDLEGQLAQAKKRMT